MNHLNYNSTIHLNLINEHENQSISLVESQDLHQTVSINEKNYRILTDKDQDKIIEIFKSFNLDNVYCKRDLKERLQTCDLFSNNNQLNRLVKKPYKIFKYFFHPI